MIIRRYFVKYCFHCNSFLLIILLSESSEIKLFKHQIYLREHDASPDVKTHINGSILFSYRIVVYTVPTVCMLAELCSLISRTMFVNYANYATYTIFVNCARSSVSASITKCTPEPRKTSRRPWLALITSARNIQNDTIRLCLIRTYG